MYSAVQKTIKLETQPFHNLALVNLRQTLTKIDANQKRSHHNPFFNLHKQLNIFRYRRVCRRWQVCRGVYDVCEQGRWVRVSPPLATTPHRQQNAR